VITARELAGRMAVKRYPRSWRGRCPCCGYAGTFSIKEGRDGRALTYCANGCERDDLHDALNRVMGGTWTPPDRPDAQDEARARERKQAAALRLWRGSAPAAGTIVNTYLTTRGLPGLAASPAVRFRGDCPHPEGGRLPAMIALVTDAADQPIGIHRTYLARDGAGKAAVEPQKATLGPIWGGSIRLDPQAPELVIGEGIESSASAGRLLGLPAWAAISAGNLAKALILPLEVRKVVIAADPDPNGREAAREAWFRLRAGGREVRIAVPDQEGRDFNDLILMKEHA
jgi:putative DNA primase/helicase